MQLTWQRRTMPGFGSSAPKTVIDTENDPRDLSFRPAIPEGATTLSPAQICGYNDAGYLTHLPAYSSSDIVPVRRYIRDLVDTVVSAPDERNACSILNYHLVCRGIYDIIQTPAILEYVADLLGDTFVCWNSQLFYKGPHDPMTVPLHQDAMYWPLTPSRSITVWLAIDDVDEDNGAMRFIPGSHLGGAVKHHERSLDGTRTLKREAVTEVEDEPVVNVLAAGEASIHSDLLLHGSPANSSPRPRAGLSLKFARPEVRTLAGTEWYVDPAVWCRGDLPAHWPNRRRPIGEHPELLAHFSGDFDGQPMTGRGQHG